MRGTRQMLRRISIHAPVKGATGGNGKVHKILRDFNPRSREGSDGFRACTRLSAGYFNPRSREGSDA